MHMHVQLKRSVYEAPVLPCEFSIVSKLCLDTECAEIMGHHPKV